MNGGATRSSPAIEEPNLLLGYLFRRRIMTCRAFQFSLVIVVAGVAIVLPAVGGRAAAADPAVPDGIVFVPKSPQERAAFNSAADEKERVADAEENESRSTILPTLLHPFESPVTHSEIEITIAAIPMRDGVKLRGSVYRPKQDGRYPVILQAGPYDMEKNLDEMPALFRNLARRGYAVVAVDSRGRYGSEGVFRPFADEIDNAFDAVVWASNQPWSTGKVGLTGISYLGWTSYCAGIAGPPGLVAIMPSAINYGLENPHGVPYLGSMAGWLIWAGRPGTSATAVTRRIDWLHLPLDRIDDEAGLPSPGFDAMVTENHLQVPGALTPVEIEKRLAKITVPTYVVAGWYDELNEGMLANYVRQAKHSKDLRLVVGPWHHNINTAYRGPEKIGIVSASTPHLDRYYHEMERFFGRYLKGDGTAWDPPRRVLIYVMGSNEWRYEDEWPLTRAVKTPVYLTSQGEARTAAGNGTLVWAAPPGEESADHYDYDPLDPVRSVQGLGVWHLLSSMTDRSDVENRDDVLVYTSTVLREDVEVTGVIEATLHASSTAPDTDFVVNLIDVYPDGHTQYLCNGIVRASYREGTGQRKLIEPDTIYEYTFKLRPISNCFQKGHRIRIEVTSSDMDRYARNQNVADAPGTTADVAVARQTIHHGGQYPSRLDLPVIPRRE
jgi:predicted acyl esterase